MSICVDKIRNCVIFDKLCCKGRRPAAGASGNLDNGSQLPISQINCALALEFGMLYVSALSKGSSSVFLSFGQLIHSWHINEVIRTDASTMPAWLTVTTTNVILYSYVLPTSSLFLSIPILRYSY